MERNLLVGNGINTHLNVSDMTMSDIVFRFRKDLIISSPFYELLFNVSFTGNVCDHLFANNKRLGIESLAEIIYSYIIKNTPQKMTLNLRMRLIDAIICTAMTAIFYNENRKIGQKYDALKLPNMDLFQKIFTLNYKEFWDSDCKCIYLHGQYNNELVEENDKPVILYSEERYRGFKNYDDVVMQLGHIYNLSPLYTRDIVFSPEFSKKSEMIKMGQYPSENLFPADDLFLHNSAKLYEELEGINQIEIFGMSPYGDDCLLEIINDMNFVTVYVYDKNNNFEAEDWENILRCPHIIKDSLEIG